jgi:DNA-binding transcriptional LysR family regulator
MTGVTRDVKPGANAKIASGYIETDIGRRSMGNGSQRIERRVTLHDLRVLMSVVEKGSMAKAAESLATSQPAISRSIADLELCLGVRLLDRGPRGVAPTPYGRALVRRGIAIFDELKQGVQDIEALADPTAGEVRIAAPIGWGAGFVASVIDRLARRYPRIVCHVTICDTTAPVLEQREVDLVVTRPFAIPPPEDHFQGELLFTESLFVIAGIGNRWARRRRMTLADLIDEPWALPPPDDQGHELLTGVFRAMGLELPRPAMVTATGVARIALVAQGRFLSIASESVLRFGGWQRAIKILPIDLAARGPVGIVTLKNRTLTPAAQLFIDSAREVAKPMAAPRHRQGRKA